MKKLGFIFASFALLTACYNQSSPEAALFSVVKAVQKDDFKNFEDLAEGQALQYLNDASFTEALKTKTQGIKTKHLSAAFEVLSSEKEGASTRELILTTLKTEKLGEFLKAEVSCETNTIPSNTTPGQCQTLPNGGATCTPGTFNPATEYTFCIVQKFVE